MTWVVILLSFPGWIPGILTCLAHMTLVKDVVPFFDPLILVHIIGWAIAIYAFGITYWIIA